MKNLLKGMAVLALCLTFSCASQKPLGLAGSNWTLVNNNLHQIEGPAAGTNSAMAFRVYRSGAPSKSTFAKWCGDFQIARVIDMAGTAKNHELAFQAQGICPDIKVIYSEQQDPYVPLTREFLEFFDQEIQKAKTDNVGILFRCTSGSHRAGRLAAYYQMKYQGLTPEQAINEMNKNGVMMPVYEKTLVHQIYALNDYIQNRPCSQAKAYCVKMEPEK